MSLFPAFETTYNGYTKAKVTTNQKVTYAPTPSYTITMSIQTDDLGSLDSVINNENAEKFTGWATGDVTGTVKKGDYILSGSLKYHVIDKPQYKRLLNQTEIQLEIKTNLSR